jgi:outer membrane scaffolding protein for murein synthesis (MipA/OmpV family)
MKTRCITFLARPVIAFGVVALVGSALAQTPALENSSKIGLGLMLNNEGYKGLGLKSTLIPAFQIQTQRFSLRGTSAEYVLTDPAHANYSINLRADLLLQGYKDSDAAIFTGMARRKPSLGDRHGHLG